MRTEERTPLGSIHISPKAIATLVYHAVQRTYGVVGLAPKHRWQRLTHLLVRDPEQGVHITHDEEGLEIDVYIVVEYGVNLRAVANSVANQVRYEVERALGLPVKAVNVHVRGLRFENTTPQDEEPRP